MTIETSAEVLTAVAAVAELLPLLGSVVEELTLAVLEIPVVRLEATLTTNVSELDAPFAISPRFQVTVPADSVPPPDAETNEVPAGSGSAKTTD